MPNAKPTVIIPSEIQAREFDGKLLLACFLAERGFSSIVGSRNEIHMAIGRLPRSIYIGKDVRHSSDRISGILTNLGHTIIALDEEAQVYFTRETYRKARVSKPAFQAARALLAWGPDNAQAWRESEFYTGAPIHEVGNPRIDLLRPELRPFFASEVEALRKRFGRYVLINTNFGTLNHFFPNLTSMKAPESPQAPPEGADWATKLAYHRYTIFRAFQNLVPVLAARFPQIPIIVRPHPSENHDTWRQAAKGAPNVQVLHEGNVMPWLLASAAVIHNGCTTGIEAYVLGATPIAYRPATSETYDLRLPNGVSHQVYGEAELLDAVDAALDNRAAFLDEAADARRALMERFATALDGRLSVERIADVVEGMEAAHGGASASGLGHRLVGHVTAEWRRLQKRRNAGKPRHKSNVAYTRHRFPDIDVPQVQQRIDAFGRILGRFGRVRAAAVEDNIFEIGQAG